MVHKWYPSVLSAFNISKETALSTILGINGFNVTQTEVFCAGINNPKITSVPLCQQFFGLPGYEEMEIEFKKHFNI